MAECQKSSKLMFHFVLLGVSAACRESFRVLTFRTSFMTQPPADIPTAKARNATHGLFSEKSHPITCCDAQYLLRYILICHSYICSIATQPAVKYDLSGRLFL